MMSDDLEWTQDLGDALTYQSKDVLTAIQQLRDEAVAKGIIKSDDKVTVVQENDNVVIQPAAAEKIYVPQYEPQMLYVPNYQPAPGFLLSGALSQLLLPDRDFLRRRCDRRGLGGRRRLGRLGCLGRRLGRRRRYRLQQLPQQHQRQGQLERCGLEERRPVQDKASTGTSWPTSIARKSRTTSGPTEATPFETRRPTSEMNVPGI